MICSRVADLLSGCVCVLGIIWARVGERSGLLISIFFVGVRIKVAVGENPRDFGGEIDAYSKAFYFLTVLSNFLA